MNDAKNILICPLEWGLGHAARMIPVAARLRELKHNVFIGAGKEHLALIEAELPGIRTIHFPGFRPGYSRWFPQYLVMLLKSPLLLYHIIREHNRLKKIISEYSIDIVISDNRFGLWNRKVTSVYVTHLLRIPLPRLLRAFEITGILLHRAVIRKYAFCFIPDLPGGLNVSGRLSHDLHLPANARYIGILSRFCGMKEVPGEFSFPHNTVILSGPEPQRSILRKKLVSVLSGGELRSVILEGKPGEKPGKAEGSITSYSHLDTMQMAGMIRSSRLVISRSGYTTIMDLICLGKSALLIPTPGQTEQEYLAGLMAQKGWFITAGQGSINKEIMPDNIPGPDLPGFMPESRKLLEEALNEMLKYDHRKTENREAGKKP